jgi:aconitate hydratase
MSVAEELLKNHLVSGELVAGSEIGIRIDQTLTQDATGTLAYLEYEALGLDRVKTELSVSYVDHNTIQVGCENGDDHRYLQSAAARYGVYYSRAGNGICHQVHLERFAVPGKTLLGADSHTPTCGGIGMLAIGAGGLDVAMAMGGAPYYLDCPRIVKVGLWGKIKSWSSPKDIALKVLEIFGTKGNAETILEYGGEGVESLDVPSRATIANMGAETGAATSIFPSDGVTKRFLKAQGREESWSELVSEDGYDLEIELGEVEPMTATPHSPRNVKRVSELTGIRVDQVCIGSCTNSSYLDLMRVARILKGRRVNPDTSLVVAPGSRQVLQMLALNGALADLIAAGARIQEPACGFCIGNSQSPSDNAVSLRTISRNFRGRSGTATAQVYLVSPETAAVAAIEGEIADPRGVGIEYPDLEMPTTFYIDDSMIIPPSSRVEGGKVSRKPLPDFEPLPPSIRGKVTIKVGDEVTTDHILPAGQLLKYRSNVEEYSRYVFAPIDGAFLERCIENLEGGFHNVIVAGEGYGQGSSREHAALCPRYLGVRCVIAKSIERIHQSNLMNFGIIPLIFENPDDYGPIHQSDIVEISKIREGLSHGSVVAKTESLDFKLKCELSERQKKIVLAGGLLPFMRGGL